MIDSANIFVFLGCLQIFYYDVKVTTNKSGKQWYGPTKFKMHRYKVRLVNFILVSSLNLFKEQGSSSQTLKTLHFYVVGTYDWKPLRLCGATGYLYPWISISHLKMF